MPRYGFNFLWMFICPEDRLPGPVDEKALDFMIAHGFDFVRLPTDYRYWITDHRYEEPEEAPLKAIDGYIDACRQPGLHANLNLHRAPGYCINRNDLEIHNLWTDVIAQDAFVLQWEMFARRYKGISGDELSFDLVNEAPHVGRDHFTREVYEKVMRRTTAAIRAIDPERPVTVDGINGGGGAIPELADLGVVHSTRGYAPMTVSHHRAGWWNFKGEWPDPVYPHRDVEGKVWDKAALRWFYQPWRDVQARGVEVHVGEFGCYKYTPNASAIAWLTDLLALYKEFGWGYSPWNFEGDFGFIGHDRPGVRYETYGGYEKVDRQYLDILMANRV